MAKENIKKKKKKSKINLSKIVVLFMLVATIALYISTIIYQIANVS